MVVFPLTLSFVFVGGMLLVALLLVLAAMRGHSAREALPEDLPVDAGRYGPAATNRWLRFIRSGFALLCIAALGVHGYWVFGAPWTYDALPEGGAFIIYDALIDDERRQNAFGLLMSLNMLIETPGGFDYTPADAMGWMKEAGFGESYVQHLVGPDSMVVGIK